MIQREELLNATDQGLAIFRHYMPVEFQVGRNFRNPFYDDRQASCNIYYDKKKGKYRLYDFGNTDYSGDCFWFAEYITGISEFPRLLERIAEDLKLYQLLDGSGSNIAPGQRIYPKIEQRANMEIKLEREFKPFTAKERAFSRVALEFWGQYGITQEVLEQYQVQELDSFTSVNRTGEEYTIERRADNLLFAYNQGEYIKIYRPMSQKARFLYAGAMPDPYCFGYKQLPRRGARLFLTSGEKDVLSLAAHGYHAICLNSETATINTLLMSSLEERFREIIVLYDMDETGRRESAKRVQELSAILTIPVREGKLPLDGSKQAKDISDFFRAGGSISELNELLEEDRDNEEQEYEIENMTIDMSTRPQEGEVLFYMGGVPIGVAGSLCCITGMTGSGKSNLAMAIVAGALRDTDQQDSDFLGLEFPEGGTKDAVLYFDTEQADYQIFDNVERGLRRIGKRGNIENLYPMTLLSTPREKRLDKIEKALKYTKRKHHEIRLVLIDGVADLIHSANDEQASCQLIQTMMDWAEFYQVCIVLVLHLTPNGLKLRGHLGSELERKATSILSVEYNAKTAKSCIKPLKVRGGGLLDVPIIGFAWDKDAGMHLSEGERTGREKREHERLYLTSLISSIVPLAEKRGVNTKACPLGVFRNLLQEVGDLSERKAIRYSSIMADLKLIEQNGRMITIR